MFTLKDISPIERSPRPSTWWGGWLCPLSDSNPSCTGYDSSRSRKSWWCRRFPPDSSAMPGPGEPCSKSPDTSFQTRSVSPCKLMLRSWSDEERWTIGEMISHVSQYRNFKFAIFAKRQTKSNCLNTLCGFGEYAEERMEFIGYTEMRFLVCHFI